MTLPPAPSVGGRCGRASGESFPAETKMITYVNENFATLRCGRGRSSPPPPETVARRSILKNLEIVALAVRADYFPDGNGAAPVIALLPSRGGSRGCPPPHARSYRAQPPKPIRFLRLPSSFSFRQKSSISVTELRMPVRISCISALRTTLSISPPLSA